jgi:uncharacterized protein YdeI (YjbR/CyaY-like superfamily)
MLTSMASRKSGTNPLKTFRAVLEPDGTALNWTVARLPFDVEKTWPVRRGNRVRGQIAGYAFRTSLFPYSRGKGKVLLVNKKMQKAAGAGVGSVVEISLEPDLEERETPMPPELATAMKEDRRLRKWFGTLGEYTQRTICALVDEAKSPESRRQRADQLVERMLLTLEGELEPPPILRAAFQRQPQARVAWFGLTDAQRRGHLLGIFYYRTPDAQERRAAKAIEEALAISKRKAAKAK